MLSSKFSKAMHRPPPSAHPPTTFSVSNANPMCKSLSLTQDESILLTFRNAPLCVAPLQAEKDAGKQAAELSQWDKLHWVRTGLSLASLAVMVATVAGAARKA